MDYSPKVNAADYLICAVHYYIQKHYTKYTYVSYFILDTLCSNKVQMESSLVPFGMQWGLHMSVSRVNYYLHH